MSMAELKQTAQTLCFYYEAGSKKRKKYPKSLRKPDLFHWALSIPALRLHLLPPTLKSYTGGTAPQE